jgi:hypothetical protein
MIKKILFKYFVTWVVLLMYFLFTIYPLVTVLLNPEPRPGDLETEEVHILKAQENTPNITGISASGKKYEFNFADSLYIAPIGGGGARFSGLHSWQLKKINGCDATVVFDRIHSIYFPEFRIWGLHCSEINWTFQDAVRIFRLDSKSGFWISVIGHLMFISFACMTFYFDRRRKWPK